jgi:hypothetical protein
MARTDETTTELVTIRGALEPLRDAAREALDTFRDVNPDEIQLEFGVKFTASGRAILAQENSSHLTVRLAWKRDSGEAQINIQRAEINTSSGVQLPVEVEDNHSKKNSSLILSAIEQAIGDALDADPQRLSMLIYMDGDGIGGEKATMLIKAVGEFVGAFDLQVEAQSGPILASLTYWFRARRRDLQKVAYSDLGKEVAAEVKRALQIRAVDIEQAKVDDAKAEAVAKLIAAVEAVPTAVIRVFALEWGGAVA